MLEATSTYAYLIYYLVLPIAYIVLLTVYGTKIQFWFMMNEVSKAFLELKSIRDSGLRKFKEFIGSLPISDNDRKRADSMLEYFTVYPVDLDPVGIIPKLKHLISTQDYRMKSEISSLLKSTDPVAVGRVMGYIEATAALNFIFKVINHFLALTKKYSSIALLQQLYAIMPILIKQGRAFLEYMDALQKGAPIGDGIGPLSVALLMERADRGVMEVAEETVAVATEIMRRKVVLVKAKGPANNLGKLDEAIERVLTLYKDVKALITIDAMLRLESEESGQAASGVGVAIGGIGVERFIIEEKSTKKGIPMYAIGVKESYVEAISVMNKEIASSVDKVHKLLFEILKTKTREGDTVVVVGVGNTLGIGQ